MTDRKNYPNYMSLPLKDMTHEQRTALTRFGATALELAGLWDDVRVSFGEPLKHDCEVCKGTGKSTLFGPEEPCDCCRGTGKENQPFPLIITGIDTSKFRSLDDRRGPGWVSVRPCDEKYGKKTYLGWYLGDIALGPSAFVRDGMLTITSHNNPAIFVPELGEVIYGCGSWWGRIDSPDDLRKITDADINSVWYVQALKDLGAKQEQV